MVRNVIYQKGMESKLYSRSSICCSDSSCAMLVAMLIGLDLYEDVKGEQEQEKIMQMWQVEEFYKYQIVDEVIKYES